MDDDDVGSLVLYFAPLELFDSPLELIDSLLELMDSPLELIDLLKTIISYIILIIISYIIGVRYVGYYLELFNRIICWIAFLEEGCWWVWVLKYGDEVYY